MHERLIYRADAEVPEMATSGACNPNDLKLMTNLISNPGLIPAQGEYRSLLKYAELANE